MKYRLTIAVPLAMLGTLAFVSPVGAQRGIGAKPAPIGHAAVRGTFASSGRSAYRYAHPSRPIYRRGNGWGIGPGWGWGALPYPDYGDYSDYPSPIKEPAPPMVMEPPQPARVIQPILIERHGDQWVEITGYSQSTGPTQTESTKTSRATALRATTTAPSEFTAPPHEVPAAVLVFRDGHEEEVKSYTIIGSTLYAKANYWTIGSWTREIEISTLDVPTTLKLNQERGSNFRLPSGPQEVMIRP